MAKLQAGETDQVNTFVKIICIETWKLKCPLLCPVQNDK